MLIILSHIINSYSKGDISNIFRNQIEYLNDHADRIAIFKGSELDAELEYDGEYFPRKVGQIVVEKGFSIGILRKGASANSLLIKNKTTQTQ